MTNTPFEHVLLEETIDLEPRRVVRFLVCGMFDHIFFVVAQQRQPAVLLLLLLHQAQTFQRTWATIDEIPSHYHLIRLPCFDVFCHGAQCSDI